MLKNVNAVGIIYRLFIFIKRVLNLVILDIIMPDMNGKEVYERLKKINSKVKVLISSGYSKAGQAQTKLADGAQGFLQKPYERAEMLYKVREVLDAT